MQIAILTNITATEAAWRMECGGIFRAYCRLIVHAPAGIPCTNRFRFRRASKKRLNARGS